MTARHHAVGTDEPVRCDRCGCGRASQADERDPGWAALGLKASLLRQQRKLFPVEPSGSGTAPIPGTGCIKVRREPLEDVLGEVP